MKIENYGVGERCAEVMRRLLVLEERCEISKDLSRIILLPIPTARDSIHITGTDKLLSEAVYGVAESDAVFGYAIPKAEKEKMELCGALVYDVLECEDFQKENAYITAIGAIGYILTELKVLPSELSFGVIGYGRIGKELIKLLLFLGARVEVYTSKETTRMELCGCGVKSYLTDYRSRIDIRGIDVLINTAPTDLSACFLPEEMTDVMIIELASGNNFGDIPGVKRLMSIPDKMYPKSAGAAYFRAIEKYVREVKK